MTPTIERTEAGDQFVAPGFETTDAERVASVRRLIADALTKARAGDKIGDEDFADAMRAEAERLARLLDHMARDRRAVARQSQGALF